MRRHLGIRILLAGLAFTLAGDFESPGAVRAQSGVADMLGRESIRTPPTGVSRPRTSITGVTLLQPLIDVQTDLAAQGRRIEEVALRDEPIFSARLANEFGISNSRLMAQRRELAASWGDLLIAHTLAANARGRTNLTRLFELRREGQDWPTIATGLGFNLSQFMSAIRQQTLVATGMVRADGRAQTIARGETAGTTTRARVIRGTGADDRWENWNSEGR